MKTRSLSQLTRLHSLLSLLSLLLLSGCAIVDQQVSEIQHPDGRIEKFTHNRTKVSGNAKQVMESTKLSNGKTQSIGTTGVSQESQSPFKDVAEMLHELNALKP